MTGTASAAIEAVGLSKRFRIRSEVRHSLKERLARGKPPAHRDFWALRDATFTVPRGSSLGIIGHNGSGKSTALKVLTGIYRPTSGTVAVNGRVAALLEVGAGFHPELTGRENIRLNGTVLGFTGAEMDRMMDEIIEFADIGDFIDNPIKHYSSGMHVRLGFAVSVMVRPDILIVDEVIAVGDEAFQRKCFDRMHALRRSGTTMVLVSHSLAQVEQLCDEALWLARGEVQQLGPVRSVTQAYLDSVNEAEAARTPAPAHPAPEQPGARRGSGEVRVTAVGFRDAADQPAPMMIAGDPATLAVEYEAHTAMKRVAFDVTLRDMHDQVVLAVSTGEHGGDSVTPGRGVARFAMSQFLVAPGQYRLRASVTVDGHVVDATDGDGVDVVVRAGTLRQGGVYLQPGSWSLDAAAAATSAPVATQGGARHGTA